MVGGIRRRAARTPIPGYIGLEAEATSSCHGAPEFVTGLMQTEDYARALMHEPARIIAPIPAG